MQHLHCKWEEKGLTMYCIYYSENTSVSSIDFRKLTKTNPIYIFYSVNKTKCIFRSIFFVNCHAILYL